MKRAETTIASTLYVTEHFATMFAGILLFQFVDLIFTHIYNVHSYIHNLPNPMQLRCVNWFVNVTISIFAYSIFSIEQSCHFNLTSFGHPTLHLSKIKCQVVGMQFVFGYLKFSSKE